MEAASTHVEAFLQAGLESRSSVPLPSPLETLNTFVDVIVPIYTFAVLSFLVAVHRQQRRLGAGLPPSDTDRAEEGGLWAFEKELVAARRAAERRREERERELEQRKKQQQAIQGEAHPLSEGAVASAVQRCVGR